MKKFKYVGAGVNRLDAVSKVTGETKYAADLKFRDMCYGKILFSAHPRARVLHIDTGSAEALPGVKRVITARDIKGSNRYGYYIPHKPALVAEGEETRYLGDSIALVVAETQAIACEAMKLINVDYKVLPPLSSPEESMSEGAYLLHEDAEKNISCNYELIHGDVGKGFNESDVIVEQTYFTARQEQAFLETESGVAYMDDSGILHVFSCLQDPYDVAEDIHLALDIPMSKIHIKGTPSGGAFGGKLNTTMQVQLAAMAYISKVPVKVVLDREESFICHPKRHPYEIKLKIGAGRDGKIRALKAEAISDAGPYAMRTHEVLGLTVSSLIGPYSMPNVHLTGKGVYTNNLDSSAFRGFGAPQAGLAREGIMEKLARVLEMDPLVLRQKNFLQPGEETISPVLGDSPVSLDLLKERIAEKMGPVPEADEQSNKKIGRAFSFDMPVFDVSAIPVLGKSGVGIAVELFADGSVSVYAGGTELGQGSMTILAQFAAEELGVPVEKVFVEMADTWTCPRAGRTSASRLTYVLGNALLLATKKIRETVRKRAGKMLEIDPDTLVLEDEKIRAEGDASKVLSLREIAKLCSLEGLQLREEGWYKYPEDRYMYGHTFMASAADVEVDMITGKIKVLKLVNVHDSGKVINPVLAAGQLNGGSVQAMGYALSEDMVLEKSELLTHSFAEYLIPTAMDIPDELVADFVETPYPTGPYGAKGLAEHALNTTTPAVLNAICNAVGMDICRNPIKPDHIIDYIKRNKRMEVQDG